jgi:hypothetical protein
MVDDGELDTLFDSWFELPSNREERPLDLMGSDTLRRMVKEGWLAC